MQELSFTYFLYEAQIVRFKAKDYNAPKFSCHTQSTERCYTNSLLQSIIGAPVPSEARTGWN